MIKKEYIPNILTILRILLIPIFIFYMLSSNYLIALICFSIASITDWADGYFARKFNAISDFGIFWDPIADKLLVLSAFSLFLQVETLSETIHIWMISIILLRDISITALRVIINSKGNIVLVTTKIAKLKTLFQMITIIWILSSLTFSGIWGEDVMTKDISKQLLNISYFLALTTTFLTLYTGIHYYYSNGRKLIHALSNR